MTLKLLHASSVTSGASLNRGGSRLAAFCEPFRDGRGGGEASEPPFDRDPSPPGESVAVLDPFLTSPFGCASPFECASPLRTGVALCLREAGTSPGWICPILAVLVSASPREGSIGRAQWARGLGVRKTPGWRMSRRCSAQTRCRRCGIRAQGNAGAGNEGVKGPVWRGAVGRVESEETGPEGKLPHACK